MTDQEILEFMRRLNSEGYAVVIFTPEELGAVDANRLEARMIEVGWDYIESQQEVEQ